MIVLPSGESFLYSGCYVQPGGLSLAQRSAWGLRLSSMPRTQAGCTRLHLVKTRPVTETFEETLRTRLDGSAGRPISKTRARLHRNGGIGDVAIGAKTAVVRIARHAVVQRGHHPYQSYRVTVDGADLLCLVIRGRAFLRQGRSERKGCR